MIGIRSIERGKSSVSVKSEGRPYPQRWPLGYQITNQVTFIVL